MAAKYPDTLSLLMVHCVGVVLSASYYQREYSGYSFTIPGFNDDAVDARTWCNQNRSKLLAITNQSIQTAVVDFIKDAIGQNQMTANNIITDGQIATGGWTWINKVTLANLNIGGQEGGASYSHSYLISNSSGFKLNADLPTNKKYYICQGQVFCGNGHEIQGRCFQAFRDDLVSWYEARNRCLQRGGDLATFEFITTKDGLNALNGSWLTPQTQYWIGLRRQWWTWQSIIDSDVTYSQWSDGHPIYYNDSSQQCLCLLPNDWKWSECRCSEKYQFVCISSAGTPVTSTSSSTPTSSTRQSSTALSATTESSSSNESSPAYRDSSRGNGAINRPLAIGLGVGLGGGILLLVAIVIIVFILCSRKGQLSFRRKRTAKADGVQQSQPDVVLQSPSSPNGIYAEIAKIPDNSTSALQDSSIGSSQTPIEYATIEIVKDRNRLIGNYHGHNARNNSKSEL